MSDSLLLVASDAGDTGYLSVLRPDAGGATVLAQLSIPLSPLALTIHPTAPVAYVVGGDPGRIVAVRFHRRDARIEVHVDDALDLPEGLPCSVAVDPSGRFLVVAHYLGGLATLRLHPDGGLGGVVANLQLTGPSGGTGRQDASYPHAVAFGPASGKLVAADLGADRLHRLDLDPQTGTISGERVEAGHTTPGSGPRHVAFLPDLPDPDLGAGRGAGTGAGRGPGEIALVSDELSSTVSSYRVSDDGYVFLASAPSTRSTASPGHTHNWPSDIIVTPSGRFAIVANRGADSLGVVAVDHGALSLFDEVPCGAWPMRLSLVGDRLYCACRDADAVESWSFSPECGRLSDHRRIPVTRPMWVEPLIESRLA